MTMASIDHYEPPDIAAVGAHASRAGADVSTTLGGIHRTRPLGNLRRSPRPRQEETLRLLHGGAPTGYR